MTKYIIIDFYTLIAFLFAGKSSKTRWHTTLFGVKTQILSSKISRMNPGDSFLSKLTTKFWEINISNNCTKGKKWGIITTSWGEGVVTTGNRPRWPRWHKSSWACRASLFWQLHFVLLLWLEESCNQLQYTYAVWHCSNLKQTWSKNLLLLISISSGNK